jgi:hypothetical protein
MKSTNELKAASQDELLNFLQADLALCSTFADLAETELSIDRLGALEALARAEHGCEIIEHFAMQIQDPERRQETEEQVNLLRSRIADKNERAASPAPINESAQ